MSPTKALLLCLCMGMGSLAFAADPTPPSATSATPPGTADAASAATTDKAAADKAAADKAAADKAKSAAATAKTATGPGGVTPDQAKTLRGAGYKADVARNGTVLYCRSQAQIGSRFEQKVCGTPDDILRSIANSQEVVNQMQHGSFTPSGPTH
jgi:hypothetical protein